MQTGDVKERRLTGAEFGLDFPVINEAFRGLKNKYSYTQVVDSIASSAAGMTKYGGLANLYFEEPNPEFSLREAAFGSIKVEYYTFEENTFCTGAAFVPQNGGTKEDDRWIITFVHNEDTNISKVLIVDAKNFNTEPVAHITLSYRGSIRNS